MKEFIIPGKPQPKQRARVTATHTYTPTETVEAEDTIRWLAKQAGVTMAEKGAPIRLTVRFYFQVANSWSKKLQQSRLGVWHTVKPDTDNLIKLIKDALNGIAYADDAQVCSERIDKYYADESYTVVQIEKLA